MWDMVEIKMKNNIKEMAYWKQIFIPKQQHLCEPDEMA